MQKVFIMLNKSTSILIMLAINLWVALQTVQAFKDAPPGPTRAMDWTLGMGGVALASFIIGVALAIAEEKRRRFNLAVLVLFLSITLAPVAMAVVASYGVRISD